MATTTHGRTKKGNRTEELHTQESKKVRGAILATHGPVVSIEDMRADVSNWPTKELKAELAKLLGFSAENLTRLAVVVTELESRGENLKSIRMGLLPILRKIASGDLLPDIVVLYAGQPALITGISKLPMNAQKRIASGEEKYSPRKSTNGTGMNVSSTCRVNLFTKTRIDEEDNEAIIEREQKKTVDGIASRGTPKDVAEMVYELIQNSSDKAIVLKHLAALLGMTFVQK